jgi:hypothetical protein
MNNRMNELYGIGIHDKNNYFQASKYYIKRNTLSDEPIEHKSI